MQAKQISKSEFKSEVIDSDIPVLVDFWAPWCVPCLMMAPELDSLAADTELNGKVKIVKVNTEEMENQSLAMEYQISSIPNMKLFKGGKVVADFVGMRPAAQLKAELIREIE